MLVSVQVCLAPVVGYSSDKTTVSVATRLLSFVRVVGERHNSVRRAHRNAVGFLPS